MIDSGNTPVGATAHIFWPQVDASDVLSLAKKLYSTHQLFAADTNTILWKVPQGFTYVPIPPGTRENYAGLFTVDLVPGDVFTGQVLSITVCRTSTRRTDILLAAPSPPAIGGDPGGGSSTSALEAHSLAAVAIGKKMTNWRYVAGSFAVSIPISTPKIMLPLEENTLAIMKWRLTQITSANRWYPVLVRYISYLSNRVEGLGGNSISMLPNPEGVPPFAHHPSLRASPRVHGKAGGRHLRWLW